jgi:hypothetical protein
MTKILAVQDTDLWLFAQTPQGWKFLTFVYEDERPDVALRTVDNVLQGLGIQASIQAVELPWLTSFTFADFEPENASRPELEGRRRRAEAQLKVGFDGETEALEWLLAHRPDWVLKGAQNTELLS